MKWLTWLLTLGLLSLVIDIAAPAIAAPKLLTQCKACRTNCGIQYGTCKKSFATWYCNSKHNDCTRGCASKC
jgi:hypothetical protein